jgi:hypothetical protein
MLVDLLGVDFNKKPFSQSLSIEVFPKIKTNMEQFIVYEHGVTASHKETWRLAIKAFDKQRLVASKAAKILMPNDENKEKLTSWQKTPE